MDILAPNYATNSVEAANGIPFKTELAFADHKGVYKPRIEKKQRKLALKLDFLKDFLEQDEEVLAITTAVSPTSFLDRVTTGMIFVYIWRCMLVFTDRRIIHVPTTQGYRYRQSLAQIGYNDIASIALKGAKLKIEYKSNAKEQFLYVRGSERRKIRALLADLNLQGMPSDAAQRHHICPRCASALTAGLYECRSCKLEFKDKTTARKRSIWLPGGGYFYTGHPWLGIGDALFESLLVFGIIVSFVPTVDFPDPDISGAIFLGVILIFEKLVTVYHANHFVKEYLTKDKEIKSPLAPAFPV